MVEKADQVFIIENGELTDSFSSFSFGEELFGEKLEGALQNLIERVPEKIIPGSQIDPGSHNPPRFIVMSREMPVESWSLDFLLIDQYGKPTLLEAKLFQNPEARRKVIGQILDYAASAGKAWSNGKLRMKAERYWSDKGKEIDDVIADFLEEDEMGHEEFWNKVQENLENNDIRLIVAMEEFTPEARRIIEFLNNEMKNVEILGLEIRCYGDSEDKLIITPIIVGQTQTTAEKKSSTEKTDWYYSNLKKEYMDIEDSVLRERLLDLLEWAKEQSILKKIRTTKPLLEIMGKVKERNLITINPNGHFYIFINPANFEGGIEERDRFVEKLNNISPVNFDMEEIKEAKEGKTSNVGVQDLTEEEFEKFKTILEEFSGG